MIHLGISRGGGGSHGAPGSLRFSLRPRIFEREREPFEINLLTVITFNRLESAMENYHYCKGNKTVIVTIFSKVCPS